MKNVSRLSTYKIIALLLHVGITSALATDQTKYTEIFCEIRPKDQNTIPHIALKEGTSANWSGYAALTNLTHPATGSVSAVYGTWTVPTLTSELSGRCCSAWVGIDGYASNTVEQIGTEHDWSSGHQTNYAWFEMYPNYAYEIVNFPLNPGDSISASVIFLGRNVFSLTITNNTRRVTCNVPTSYTTTTTTVQRNSAEWIVEAPYDNGILPLAHFGTIQFSNCTATINGKNGVINNRSWVFDELTMVTNQNVIKSQPSALSLNGAGFTTAWRHE